MLNQLEPSQVEAENLPVLSGLAPGKRAEILGNAVQHSVAPGTILFEHGELPNFQLIVLAGSVQLLGRASSAREVLIEVVRAPDLVIPAAVAMNAPYLMRARVPEPSRLLMIPAAAFRDAIAAHPALATAVIGSLALQFRRMVRQVKNLKLRSSTERVGCYLLALSARQDGCDRVVLPYEKNLIASELGITRESFSRALATLARSGIKVNGQTITIVDAAQLAAACRPDPLIDGSD